MQWIWTQAMEWAIKFCSQIFRHKKKQLGTILTFQRFFKQSLNTLCCKTCHTKFKQFIPCQSINVFAHKFMFSFYLIDIFTGSTYCIYTTIIVLVRFESFHVRAQAVTFKNWNWFTFLKTNKTQPYKVMFINWEKMCSRKQILTN